MPRNGHEAIVARAAQNEAAMTEARITRTVGLSLAGVFAIIMALNAVAQTVN